METLMFTEDEKRELEKLLGREVCVSKIMSPGHEEQELRIWGDICLKGDLREFCYCQETGVLKSVIIEGGYYPCCGSEKKIYELILFGDCDRRVPRFDFSIYFEGRRIFKAFILQTKEKD